MKLLVGLVSVVSAEFIGGCADGSQNSMICASDGEQCEILNWSQGRGNSVAMRVIFQTARSFAASMTIKSGPNEFPDKDDAYI